MQFWKGAYVIYFAAFVVYPICLSHRSSLTEQHYLK